MRFLPPEERPRERLLACGEDHLSSAELLAILLCSGTKGKSVLALAQELIIHFHGIQGLFKATIEELMEVKGIGPAKAIQLKAAFALALKAQAPKKAPKMPLHSPLDAFHLIQKELTKKSQEMCAVILRDTRGNAFHSEVVSVGTLSEVLVHPREIFYPAIHHRAKSLILAHNHPSGDPSPSPVDLQLTKLLVASSQLLGIKLDDHLIIGDQSYHSFWEQGFIVKGKRY